MIYWVTGALWLIGMVSVYMDCRLRYVRKSRVLIEELNVKERALCGAALEVDADTRDRIGSALQERDEAIHRRDVALLDRDTSNRERLAETERLERELAVQGSELSRANSELSKKAVQYSEAYTALKAMHADSEARTVKISFDYGTLQNEYDALVAANNSAHSSKRKVIKKKDRK